MLGACGDTAEAPVQTEAQTDAETTAAVTEEVRLYQDSLPADLETEGKTLRLMSGYSDGSTFHSMLTAQEENEGELVNDAMREANLTITERFGITVTEELFPFNDVTANAKKSINAGDDAYDIITGIDRDVYTFATQNMILPLDTLKYVDLDAPWWNASINEALTVGGRLWAGYSDAMLTSYDFTHIMLFNKELISGYDMDDPYQQE
jgi:hypothetical protein